MELAIKYAGKVTVAKIDIADYQSTAQQYSVLSIPTIILFSHGKETGRVSGLRSLGELEKDVAQYLP